MLGTAGTQVLLQTAAFVFSMTAAMARLVSTGAARGQRRTMTFWSRSCVFGAGKKHVLTCGVFVGAASKTWPSSCDFAAFSRYETTGH